MVALQCVDSLGVAQCSPLVSLMCVGFGQHLQLVCDVLVEVITFGLRRLSTDPLARYGFLSIRSSIWTGVCAGGGTLLFRVATGDESFQVVLGDTIFVSVSFFVGVLDCLEAGTAYVSSDRLLTSVRSLDLVDSKYVTDAWKLTASSLSSCLVGLLLGSVVASGGCSTFAACCCLLSGFDSESLHGKHIYV